MTDGVSDFKGRGTVSNESAPSPAPKRVYSSAAYIAPRAPEDRQALIAQAAFLIAERRGFEPGHELEDWLAAESEVDQRLAAEGRVFGA
jgi:hypothetical protein